MRKTGSGTGHWRVWATLCALLGALVSGCVPTPNPSPAPSRMQEAWTRATPAPLALTEVAAATAGGKVWVAGGLTGDGRASPRVVVFDPVTERWADGPDLPERVHHAALASNGSTLWLIGGYRGSGFDTPTASVRRLDPGASRWTDDAPLPAGRAAGGAAWDGGRIVYAGGVGPGALASEVFALAGGTWTRIGRLPTAREHLAATSDARGRTYVLGGRVAGLQGNLANVDLVEGEQVSTLGELPTPRGGVAAFWSPALGACLLGGESPGGTNPEVECIAADGRQTSLPDLGTPRHGLGAAVVGETAFSLLGGERPGLFASDVVERLDLP